MMEAAVGHDEVEGRGGAQLLLHGDETRAAIEPPGVAHEPRVDVVAHVAQARRLESGREEPRAAAKVEGKGALGQREGAQALPQVPALLELVEADHPLGYVMEKRPGHAAESRAHSERLTL